jgi:hypothetical protein
MTDDERAALTDRLRLARKAALTPRPDGPFNNWPAHYVYDVELLIAELDRLRGESPQIEQRNIIYVLSGDVEYRCHQCNTRFRTEESKQ